MRPLALIAALALATPLHAQQAAPEPEVIVEDTTPMATGVVVGVLSLLVLAAVLAGAGD